MRTAIAFAAAAVVLAVVPGCYSTVHRAGFATPAEPTKIDTTAEFLKVHTKNGDVYVLEKWNVDMGSRVVSGQGLRYDRDRNPAGEIARQSVSLDDVVLFETNRPEKLHHPEVWSMAIVTAGSLAVTGVCAANPKTCFGSCPTFYPSGESDDLPEAEGFSASIARALEATDVDSMWTTRPRSTQLSLRMRNEALETHSVEHVRILAARRPPNGRVLRAGETFYEATKMHAPTSCSASTGDCLADVVATDRREWSSPASATDLAEEETIDLTFPRGRGKLGVLVVARNTLLNTFVFYQMLAYAGRDAGDWFARLEREGAGGLGMDRLASMSDIHVDAEMPAGWVRAGAYSELGPIAREAQLVPLPDVTGTEVHVRLRAARGNFKIEQVALAELGDAVTPVAIDPHRLTRAGADDASSLATLLRPGAHLVANPGDTYTLHFELPDTDRELFLESRGYYYEWMRPEWLHEEDPGEVIGFLLSPARTLRRLAPKYKEAEGRMEEAFWRSRFGAKP